METDISHLKLTTLLVSLENKASVANSKLYSKLHIWNTSGIQGFFGFLFLFFFYIGFKWVYDTTSDEFEKVRAEMNKKLERIKFFQLGIQPEDIVKIISHIIVSKDDDVPEIINEIMKSPKIFGHKLPKEKKQLLISKVTSFERIEKDY